MQHLGVILNPYGAHSPYGFGNEIAQARGGAWGIYLPQPVGYPRIDRQHITRGEVGFYYDSRLGGRKPTFLERWRMRRALRGLGDMIPTDAELAKNTACYTPVHSGWINTPNGYLPTPWRFGWNPAGAYGPSTSLSGLGDVDPVLSPMSPSPQSATDVIAVMNAHNKRVFQLAIISTTAVSISALFTLWTRWKRLKHDIARR